MKNRHNNGAHLHAKNFNNRKKCEIIIFMRILAHSLQTRGEWGNGLCARIWTTANDETSCTVSNFHTWFAYENCHCNLFLRFGRYVDLKLVRCRHCTQYRVVAFMLSPCHSKREICAWSYWAVIATNIYIHSKKKTRIYCKTSKSIDL